MLNTQELDHLLHLCKIQLDEKERENMLSSMQDIVQFLGELKEGEADVNKASTDKLICFEESKSSEHPRELLENCQHPLTHDAINIQTSLK